MLLPRRHKAEERGVLGGGLAQASPAKTPLGWKAAGLALPVALALLLMARDRSGGGRREGGVSFDRDRLVSADLAGLQASTDQLVTEGEASHGLEPSKTAPSSSPRLPSVRAPRLPTGTRRVSEEAGRCETCGGDGTKPEEATETLYEAPRGREVVSPEEAKVHVPLGTRIAAVVKDSVTTAPEGAPVTAEVQADVAPGGRLAIPAGARLEGLAFGTDVDDRARILVVAAILGARTVPLPGVALDEDGSVGLPGRVVSKGSKGKHGGGMLLRALGGAAGYGLGGTQGIAGAALAELGVGLSQDLSTLTRDWMISSKAVRVPPGTRMVVYVRSDSVMP